MKTAGRDGSGPGKGTAGGEKYMKRCFVLTRSAAQFWRFARFDARATAPSPRPSWRARIRAVVARPIWNAKRYPERVTIGGFANLREASAAEPDVFRANLGGWWQSYFRFGNWRIILPTGPRDQRAACCPVAAIAGHRRARRCFG